MRRGHQLISLSVFVVLTLSVLTGCQTPLTPPISGTECLVFKPIPYHSGVLDGVELRALREHNLKWLALCRPEQ